MQFTTFFAVLVTTITMVQARCYSGGETWSPDQVQANLEVSGVCDNISGGFSSGQTKYACRNAGTPDKKLEFSITNTAGGSLSVSHDECVFRLSIEINGCSHGGDTTTAGWRFRADPNSGRC
ncbi:hypothetical protein BKA70DRAFT_1234884 [Coprinopsis sp. MPI-PUGE-AT-0042]|nr:hypothetical protein BKA70DRAFT_1234884 [Coprinopsis sp. MPI-PUGE-AT-0042]